MNTEIVANTDVDVKHLNVEKVDSLVARGYRPIPYYAELGKYSKRVDGQEYPSSDSRWNRAAYPAIALDDDMLLIDLDGYKDGAATPAQIAAALGMSETELNRALVQIDSTGKSIHWLFRIPSDADISSSNGVWLPFVDLKGVNCMMNVKHGKMDMIPHISEIQPLDMSRIVLPLPMRNRGAGATSQAVTATETNEAGRRALAKAVRAIEGCAEGGRNAELNNQALIIGHYVAGGDITEHDARQELSIAAAMVGLDSGETAATIASGFKRGMSEPQLAKRTPAEIFADVMAKPITLAPDVVSFDSVAISDPVDTSDHGKDALLLHERVFQRRLARFNDGLRWWNGEAWEHASDDTIKRHINKAMMMGHIKVTSSRINGTAEVLRLTVDVMGEVNPVSQSVYFKNGALNVTTGAMIEHNRDNRNGFTIGATYNPSADCKVFKAWLAEIFSGELERVDLLQEIIGWLLISDNLNIQKAPIFIGASRGGKGTILELVAKLLGEAQGEFRFQGLNEDKTLASMGARQVAIDWDAKSPSSKNAIEVCSVFKTVSANEPIAVKMLWEQITSQRRLNCKMILAANSIPNLYDDSGASAGRWMPLVFTKSYAGNEDLTLSARLSDELDGIAVWAVEGLRRLMRNGGKFTQPESSRDMLDNMLERGSPLEAFVDDMLSVGGDNRCSDAEMFAHYMAWCVKQSTEPMKRATFLSSLAEVGYSKGFSRSRCAMVNGKQMRGFVGVKPNSIPQNIIPIPKQA